jgi:glycosyltransferase involved in cell wall biosynthesis
MSPNALLLNKIDYGVSFWDMAHLEHTLFPESRNNYYSLPAREFIYKHLADNSLYIVTDCNENKINFNFRYNVKNDKINIIYSEPSSQLIDGSQKVIFSKEQLVDNFKIKTQEYIFYPAQYWAHKNHIYILESLNILINKYHKEITFVFCGSDKKNLEYLKSGAEKLGVSVYVKFLDFVSEEIIYNLYNNSFAIIAPTYFGPTNHLSREAFYFGKPFFYSDIFCDNEQVKGAAIKIDLNNPGELSEKINKLIQRRVQQIYDYIHDENIMKYILYESLNKSSIKNINLDHIFSQPNIGRVVDKIMNEDPSKFKQILYNSMFSTNYQIILKILGIK